MFILPPLIANPIGAPCGSEMLTKILVWGIGQKRHACLGSCAKEIPDISGRVCIYAYMYMSMDTMLYIKMYVHAYVCVCICMYVHAYVCVYGYVCMCICLSLSGSVGLYVLCVSPFICFCVFYGCAYVYVFMCKYIRKRVRMCR